MMYSCSLRELPSYLKLQINFDMYIPIFTAVKKIGENYNLQGKVSEQSIEQCKGIHFCIAFNYYAD